MVVINLTPHTINIHTEDDVMKVPASGQVARVTEERQFVGRLPNGIPVQRVEYGSPYGLPGPAEGVIYVVSRIVKNAAPERKDVYAPGPAVRDRDGRVMGCEGLSV
jgi:hypothetical protein